MRRALDSAWRRVEEATRKDAELRMAIAVEEEREREATNRVAALAGTVGPVLERIAAGEVLTPSEARAVDLLESAVRDQLVAPVLVDAELSLLLGDARARGVQVDIVAAGDQSDDQPGATEDGERSAASYRAVLAAVLDHVARGTQVRVVWAVSGGTIGVVGPGMAAVQSAVSDAIRGLPACWARLTGDEDTVLVEF